MTRIRFATRALAKTPVVTLVVIVSLGLGIGANTAIFSLLHQLVLSSLPVPHPEQLALITSPAEFKGGRTSMNDAGGAEYVFSYKVFRELEKNSSAASVAGFRNLGANLAFRNQTLNGAVLVVSGNYFSVLGVQPMLGRFISPQDDVPGNGQPVAVLGYGYWKDRLGGRTDVLNQSLRVNGHPMTIVGIAPRGFTGTVLGSDPEVFVPLSLKPLMTPGWNGTDSYNDYWLYTVLRLKPGVSMSQAATALNTVYAGVVDDQAKNVKDRDAKFIQRFRQSRLSLKDGSQGQSSLRSESRVPIFTLMAATVLVLLIAMANAANLLLARSAQRRKELAIRTALGASRVEIMLDLLTEAMLLSVVGGVAGVLIGAWTLNILLSQIADSDAPAYFVTADMNWPVMLFSIGVSLVSGLIFGLYPAFEASRTKPASTLKDLSTATSAGQGAAQVRRMLVCAQVMLSAVLLVPTGLFLKSLVNLLHVDLGLRTENVITFGVSPELNGYKTPQAKALFDRMESELAAIPGVTSVTDSLVALIAGNNWGNNLTVEGYPTGPDADTNANYNEVGPGYFGKMGMALVAGREITEQDGAAAPKVTVINETFARHFFGSGNPIGRKLTPGSGKVTPNIEIVGVIKDAKYSSVKQKTPRVYYIPWRQSKESNGMSFYIRTALPPAKIMPQIRHVMATIDRDLPLESLRTLEEQVSRNIRSDRLVLQLAATFAVIATMLAMLGLYGVMAYSVTRRTREIGIRMALGAGANRIRSMVMRELFTILVIGLAVGIPAALGLSIYAKSQLFGVEAFDIGIIAAAIAALIFAALMAGYIPVRRATRVSPTQALRYE